MGTGTSPGMNIEVPVLLWLSHPHPGRSKIRAWQNNENIRQVPFAATCVLFDSIHGPRVIKIISKRAVGAIWNTLPFAC